VTFRESNCSAAAVRQAGTTGEINLNYQLLSLYRLLRYGKTTEARRMKPELTPRQNEVYEAIKVHIEKVGFPPTLIELAELIGCSSQNAAAEHVKALRKRLPLHCSWRCQALPSSKQNWMLIR
jgi:hypothetical protein